MTTNSNADVTLRQCPGCGGPLVGRQRACSARCRKRLQRQRGTYVITAADRAAIEKVRALPLPIPRLHPDDVRRHVLSTAAVNGDEP